jgi:hypothetical protein
VTGWVTPLPAFFGQGVTHNLWPLILFTLIGVVTRVTRVTTIKNTSIYLYFLDDTLVDKGVTEGVIVSSTGGEPVTR